MWGEGGFLIRFEVINLCLSNRKCLCGCTQKGPVRWASLGSQPTTER